MSGDAWHRRDRGFALLLVLWSVALLGLIAASFATTVRTNALIARNTADNAAARALADGGVMLAVFNLIDRDRQDAWRADGTTHRIGMRTGQISVSAVDEGGKIDINADTGEMLADLLRGLGLADPEALAIAEAVADFRDPDDIPRPHGAEREDYRRAGLGRSPPDRPFAAVTELLDVKGLTPGIFARIEPFVTVHSGIETVNPATAPREVLLALTGADSVAVDEILAAREGRGTAADSVPGVPAVDLDRFETTEVRRVTITSVGTTAAGARFVRQAIVGLEESGRSDNPYRFLAWTQRFD